MKFRLGISSSHNSSAALMDDRGEIVFAIQEERLSRVKNHWALPELSIAEALKRSGGWSGIEKIVAGGIVHPATRHNISRQQIELSLREVLLRPNLGQALSSPRKLLSLARRQVEIWRMQMDRDGHLRRQKVDHQNRHRRLLHEVFPETREIPLAFVAHHDAHAGSACFGGKTMLQEDLLVFSYDGQGDGLCASVRLKRKGGSIELLHEIEDENSLSTLYGFTTFLLGFVIFEHEYKLMGMAPYANQERAREITTALKSLYDQNPRGWKLRERLRLVDRDESKFFAELQRIFRFKRFDEICAGVQLLIEDFMTQWVAYWVAQTGVRNIAMAGGVFLNVKANMRVMDLDCVDDLFIFPSCGDETNCIGALYHEYFKDHGKAARPISTLGLGRSFSPAEIDSALQRHVGQPGSMCRIETPGDIESAVAELLANGQIVARFEGREEFGARALGRRSILADPSRESVVDEINHMIKKRDFWMPFACSILDVCEDEYIRNPKRIKAAHMILCFPCTENVRDIAAGTHPQDHTVRAQIVSASENPKYYKLIQAFRDKRGIGAVLNTSFNLQGYPLVGSPDDALQVFLASGLKYLALEGRLVTKE